MKTCHGLRLALRNARVSVCASFSHFHLKTGAVSASEALWVCNLGDGWFADDDDDDDDDEEVTFPCLETHSC